MEVTQGVQDEFDKLYDAAASHPSTFKLASLGGYLLNHPEIVGKPLCEMIRGDREHRQRLRER